MNFKIYKHKQHHNVFDHLKKLELIDKKFAHTFSHNKKSDPIDRFFFVLLSE